MSFGPSFTLLIQAGSNAREVLTGVSRDPAFAVAGVRLSSAFLAEDVLAITICTRRLESWVFGGLLDLRAGHRRQRDSGTRRHADVAPRARARHPGSNWRISPGTREADL